VTKEKLSPGNLARVKKKEFYFGALVRIMERVQDDPPVYQVEFPRNSLVTFFFEDELERAESMSCPDCIKQGVVNKLTEPEFTAEGWAQECLVHGAMFLWGWKLN